MFTITNVKNRVLAIYGSLSICIFMTGCIVDSIPDTPIYQCEWPNSITAQFINLEFSLPSSNCDNPFFCAALDYVFPQQSIYGMMEAIHGYNFGMQFNSSVYDKVCESESVNPLSLAMKPYPQHINQDNYWCYLSQNDMLEEVPMVSSLSSLNADDLKHELILQLYNVTNDITDATGTVTWKRTWDGQTASEYFDSLHTWFFYFPPYALKGTFTPYSGNPRYIYYHDHFDYY